MYLALLAKLPVLGNITCISGGELLNAARSSATVTGGMQMYPIFAPVNLVSSCTRSGLLYLL